MPDPSQSFRLAAGLFLDGPEELPGVHLKDLGEFPNDLQAYERRFTLDLADMRPVDLGEVGQFLLGKVVLVTEAAKIHCKQFAQVHIATKRVAVY